jgi:GTP-binding protein YchF
MALNCGIVGLPNVGKSTIFQALSGAPAEAANYPFCTINPNVGIVNVSDARLDTLTGMFKPQRKIPAAVEFVDIAGLVKGASQGEGLGNQFLSHIREAGMIAHVVRCFEDADVVHVAGKVDPASDMDVINTELALADLDTLAKRREKAARAQKVQSGDDKKAAAVVLAALDKIEPLLQAAGAVRDADLTDDEQAAVADCFFITAKPQIYVCNTDEAGIKGARNRWIDIVKERAEKEHTLAVVISGKFEAELSDIEDPAEKAAFLEDAGLSEPGLDTLARAAYKELGLCTFFTAGSDECRAWTIRAGWTAPTAAGVIHPDFEKGFIKAEVYSYEDLLKYGAGLPGTQAEVKVKEAGRYRIEGRDYVVQDGDLVFFKFNV